MSSAADARSFPLGALALFVDERERTRSEAKRQLIDALRANVTGNVRIVVATLKRSGDVIVARVTARTDAPAVEDDDDDDTDKDGATAVTTAFVAAFADTLDPTTLLVDATTTYWQPLTHTERKSLLDFVQSSVGATDVPREEHLHVQMRDGVAFARATGSRFSLLVEGFQQAHATTGSMGALSTNYGRARLATAHMATQCSVVQTLDVEESALTFLAWAAFAEKYPDDVRPQPYVGFADAAFVAQPRLLVRSSGVNDTDARAWFRNVALASINQLGSDAVGVVADALGNHLVTAVERLAALPSYGARVAFIAALRSPTGARKCIGPAVAARIVARFAPRDDAEESCGMLPTAAAAARTKRARTKR